MLTKSNSSPRRAKLLLAPSREKCYNLESLTNVKVKITTIKEFIKYTHVVKKKNKNKNGNEPWLQNQCQKVVEIKLK